jgi:acyl-CoA synthetase (AMP-forming)/AMP-acid ligase II
MPGTELKVVDPDTKKEVPEGCQGLILARGPGIMKVGFLLRLYELEEEQFIRMYLLSMY